MTDQEITQAQMMEKASNIADYYAYTEQQMFYILIDSFKKTRPELVNAEKDPQKIMEWRLKALSELGGLTDKVINLISRSSGYSRRAIYDLIEKDGLKVTKQFNRKLAKTLKKPVHDVSLQSRAIINSYVNQTMRGVNNYVNQTLLTRNYGKNTAAKTYQEIVNKTVLDVIVGKKTPQKALMDNIYSWRDKGMSSALIDKAGHQWSLEGYTRAVIQSTTSRVYNDLRIQSLKEFDSVLCVMSSHPAARPACAPIQGKIVCIVPKSDPRCEDSYPNIYDHGYGTPAGTQGINCQHALYPYIKGVSHNYQKQYDPDEAVKKMQIQQKQRYYERGVRKNKRKLELAQRAGDADGISKYSAGVRGYQAKLRKIVKEHDFLARQYSREQIANETK